MKEYKRVGLGFLALALLAVIGLAAGVSLAQRPQGPWIKLEASISPEQVPIGEGFLTTLTLRNEGTESAMVDVVSAALPSGVIYVGQAFGSDVAGAAQTSSTQLRWMGPFTLPAGAELKIGFVAFASEQAARGRHPVRAAALSGEQPVASAELSLTLLAAAVPEVSAPPPSQVETAPALPSAVEIGKTALPTRVEAGDFVSYTVTFTNTESTTVTLVTITDQLPLGFKYLGQAHGSDVDQPSDDEEPEIIWGEDPERTLPPMSPQGEDGDTLLLRYYVRVPSETGANTRIFTNSVTADYDATTIGPAKASVTMEDYKVYLPAALQDYISPHFTITKKAAPETVLEGVTGEVVTYTVQLANGGSVPGVLNTIEDTLPAGFTLLGMAPGSDVTASPSGTTGKIVWEGPFTVAAYGDLTLIYRVRAANTAGTYVNSATATTLVGSPPEAPASATVKVTPPIFFQDDFEDGIGQWTPFTNYWRLHPEQWSWDQGGGYGGSNGYQFYWMAGATDPHRGAEDALTMVLAPYGSEDWTDYRYQIRFNLLGGRQVGLWFRGDYEDVDTNGQWLTGYYFTVVVRKNWPDTAKLWQLRTTEEHGDEIHDYYWYHFSNPLLLAEKHIATSVEPGRWHQIRVEVEGPRIKGYVDDELAIDYTDATGSIFLKGTVGLYLYGSDGNYSVVKFDDALVEPLD